MIEADVWELVIDHTNRPLSDWQLCRERETSSIRTRLQISRSSDEKDPDRYFWSLFMVDDVVMALNRANSSGRLEGKYGYPRNDNYRRVFKKYAGGRPIEFTSKLTTETIAILYNP